MTRVAWLTALVFTVAGCGGGDPCAGSRCPNDARQSASEYQSCVNRHDQRRNDKCYRESVNHELCIQASTVCDSNGRTDGRATFNSASRNCEATQKAVLCCASSFFCN